MSSSKEQHEEIPAIPNSGVISLSTVLRRLESTTARLEDIVFSQQQANKVIANPQQETPHETVHHTEPTTAAVVEKLPVFLEDYNSLIDTLVKPFVELSGQYNSELLKSKTHSLEALLEKSYDLVLKVSTNTKEPTDNAAFSEHIQPLMDLFTDLSNSADSNEARKSEHFQQLKILSEATPAFGWFTMKDKPFNFIQEIKDSTQFYTNRLIKDKNELNLLWVQGLLRLLDELSKYVKKHHFNGLAWNNKGASFEEFVKQGDQQESSQPKSAPATSAPPPPPPPAPAPAPVAQQQATPAAPAAANPEAVFAELNKGSDITKGLRKVDKSQMNHKNPELAAKKAVPSLPAKPKALTRSPSSQTTITQKQAKLELDGQKWFIENHTGNNNIVIEDTKLTQTVNIFNCKNSVIQVKGKVNAVNLVGCHKTSVLLENLVSSLSITTSPNFTVQILGLAPTVTVDNTDVGQIYLSKQCLESDTEIITAKTSSINISVPQGDDGDFVEKPIPEQLKTIVKDGKLQTTVVEHSG
ncbi:hypothetical protein E3Q23_02315 [Wallemia mellicola]|uniref:Adenylyl cyclase-associated protein n=1 Tax=Wallemia mellicola TaxID=1708541 RepID=A0A4T0TIU6_9BASI|nr:hypothetical protein E3Q23_02315 [Wallemia mellicola]TIC64754.1 hypothetical protein E3Q01_02570 [Wallemia mellicola]